MDNLTHTLVGIVAGDSIARSGRAAPGGLAPDTRRTFFISMSVIGGLLPDLDLLITQFVLAGDKVGYLLHHRGHTHTVLGCVALAFLLYAGAEGWARMRHLALARSDRIALIGMALLSVLLHLVMDSLNSYGVHPYWPFYNGWVYGDSMFIIEPLYWVAAAPMLFVVRTWLARVVIGLAVLAALALSIFVNQSLPAWYAGIALVTIILLAVGKRGSPRTAALTSAAAMFCVTAAFVWSGRAAASRVDSIASGGFPADATLDHALSPTPTNPLCWDVLLVQTGNGRYSVRHGMVSVAPGILASDLCPAIRFGQRTTAPMTAVSAPASRDVRWWGEFSMPRAELASLVAGHCDAQELMQFARVPFATEVKGRWVLGDMRFDRDGSLGLAEIEVGNPHSRCRYDVPWVPPRASLLEPAVEPVGQSFPRVSAE